MSPLSEKMYIQFYDFKSLLHLQHPQWPGELSWGGGGHKSFARIEPKSINMPLKFIKFIIHPQYGFDVTVLIVYWKLHDPGLGVGSLPTRV